MAAEIYLIFPKLDGLCPTTDVFRLYLFLASYSRQTSLSLTSLVPRPLPNQEKEEPGVELESDVQITNLVQVEGDDYSGLALEWATQDTASENW